MRLLADLLALQQTHLGSDHLGTLTTMHKLARWYRVEGRIEKALRFVQQVDIWITISMKQIFYDLFFV